MDRMSGSSAAHGREEPNARRLEQAAEQRPGTAESAAEQDTHERRAM